MMIDGVSRIQNPQENLFKEDNDLLLEMLSEMQKETVEDGKGKGEDGFLIGDTIFQETIAESVFDDRDELLAVEESGAWPLNYCKNQF